MSIEELAQALAYVDPPLPFVSSETAVYFIRVLDQLLAESHLQGKLILPNLREHFERISVYSDYGGEHKDAQYNTYAFLIVGHDLSGHALKKMQDVRREYGLCDPYKEIEYKELRYGPLGRAVPDLLNAADGLPGLLLVLVVDKRLTTILGADSEETLRLAQSTLQGVGVSVKDKVAEKLLRVLHCVSYLCSLLGLE